MTFADECLKRAKKAPLYFGNREAQADFYDQARIDVPELARRLKKACVMFRRIANMEKAINEGDGKYWDDIADELEAPPEGK